MLFDNREISGKERKRIDDITFWCTMIGSILLIVTTIYTIWNLQSNVKVPAGESVYLCLEWWVQGLKGIGIQAGITLSFIVILLLPRSKYKVGLTIILCVGIILSLFGTISYNQKTSAVAMNEEIISEAEYERLEYEYDDLVDTIGSLTLGTVQIPGTNKTRDIDINNPDDVLFRDLTLRNKQKALESINEKMRIYENKGKGKSVVNAAFSNLAKLFGLKNQEEFLRLMVHMGYAIFLDFGALLLLGVGPKLRKRYNLDDVEVSVRGNSQRLIGSPSQKLLPKLPSKPDNTPSPFSPPPNGGKRRKSSILDGLKSKLNEKLSQFNSPKKDAQPQSNLSNLLNQLETLSSPNGNHHSQSELDLLSSKPTTQLNELKSPSRPKRSPHSDLSDLLNQLDAISNQNSQSRNHSILPQQNLDLSAEFNQTAPSRKKPILPEQNLDLSAEFNQNAKTRKNSALPKQNLRPKAESNQNAPSRKNSILPEQNSEPSAEFNQTAPSGKKPILPEQNSPIKAESKQNQKTLSLEAARRKKQDKTQKGQEEEGKYAELMKAWDSLSNEEQSYRLFSTANKVLNDFVKTMYHKGEKKDGQLKGYKSVSKTLGIRERIGQECHNILKELDLVEVGPNAQGQKYSYPKNGMSQNEMLEKLRSNDNKVIIKRGGSL